MAISRDSGPIPDPNLSFSPKAGEKIIVKDGAITINGKKYHLKYGGEVIRNEELLQKVARTLTKSLTTESSPLSKSLASTEEVLKGASTKNPPEPLRIDLNAAGGPAVVRKGDAPTAPAQTAASGKSEILKYVEQFLSYKTALQKGVFENTYPKEVVQAAIGVIFQSGHKGIRDVAQGRDAGPIDETTLPDLLQEPGNEALLTALHDVGRGADSSLKPSSADVHRCAKELKRFILNELHRTPQVTKGEDGSYYIQRFSKGGDDKLVGDYTSDRIAKAFVEDKGWSSEADTDKIGKKCKFKEHCSSLGAVHVKKGEEVSCVVTRSGRSETPERLRECVFNACLQQLQSSNPKGFTKGADGKQEFQHVITSYLDSSVFKLGEPAYIDEMMKAVDTWPREGIEVTVEGIKIVLKKPIIMTQPMSATLKGVQIKGKTLFDLGTEKARNANFVGNQKLFQLAMAKLKISETPNFGSRTNALAKKLAAWTGKDVLDFVKDGLINFDKIPSYRKGSIQKKLFSSQEYKDYQKEVALLLHNERDASSDPVLIDSLFQVLFQREMDIHTIAVDKFNPHPSPDKETHAADMEIYRNIVARKLGLSMGKQCKSGVDRSGIGVALAVAQERYLNEVGAEFLPTDKQSPELLSFKKYFKEALAAQGKGVTSQTKGYDGLKIFGGGGNPSLFKYMLLEEDANLMNKQNPNEQRVEADVIGLTYADLQRKGKAQYKGKIRDPEILGGQSRASVVKGVKAAQRGISKEDVKIVEKGFRRLLEEKFKIQLGKEPLLNSKLELEISAKKLSAFEPKEGNGRERERLKDYLSDESFKALDLLSFCEHRPELVVKLKYALQLVLNTTEHRAEAKANQKIVSEPLSVRLQMGLGKLTNPEAKKQESKKMVLEEAVEPSSAEAHEVQTVEVDVKASAAEAATLSGNKKAEIAEGSSIAGSFGRVSYAPRRQAPSRPKSPEVSIKDVPEPAEVLKSVTESRILLPGNVSDLLKMDIADVTAALNQSSKSAKEQLLPKVREKISKNLAMISAREKEIAMRVEVLTPEEAGFIKSHFDLDNSQETVDFDKPLQERLDLAIAKLQSAARVAGENDILIDDLKLLQKYISTGQEITVADCSSFIEILKEGGVFSEEKEAIVKTKIAEDGVIKAAQKETEKLQALVVASSSDDCIKMTSLLKRDPSTPMREALLTTSYQNMVDFESAMPVVKESLNKELRNSLITAEQKAILEKSLSELSELEKEYQSSLNEIVAELSSKSTDELSNSVKNLSSDLRFKLLKLVEGKDKKENLKALEAELNRCINEISGNDLIDRLLKDESIPNTDLSVEKALLIMNKSVISSATLFSLIKMRLFDPSVASEVKDKLVAFCNNWVARNAETAEFKKSAVVAELRDMQSKGLAIKLPEKKAESSSVENEVVMSAPAGTTKQSFAVIIDAIRKKEKVPDYTTYVNLIASDLFAKCSAIYMDLSVDDLASDKWLAGSSPKMQQYSEFFNKLSQSVTSQVLSSGDENTQKALIKFFLDVASVSYSQGNFTAVEAIWSGLQSEVFNLKDKSGNSLLDLVSKESPYDSITDTLEKYGMGSNFANKRKIYDDLASSGKPFMPYLGMYLTDLTFTRDGNPGNVITEGKSTCNFKKLGQLYEVTRKALSGKRESLKSKSSFKTDFVDMVDSQQLVSPQRLLFMRKSIENKNLFASLSRAKQMFVVAKFNNWSQNSAIDKDLSTTDEEVAQAIKLKFENERLASKLVVEDSLKELREQLEQVDKKAAEDSHLQKLLTARSDEELTRACKGLDVDKQLSGVDKKIVSTIKKIQSGLAEEAKFSSILKQINDALK